MAEEARDGAGPRQWLLVAAYVLAIAAWLVFSIPRRGTDGTAYWLGQILGAALITLSIPLLTRFIYWQAKGRRPHFWTPLIFVLAAVLAVFVKVGTYANEEVQREDRATEVLKGSAGSRSDDVRGCVRDLFELDETQQEGPPPSRSLQTSVRTTRGSLLPRGRGTQPLSVRRHEGAVRRRLSGRRRLDEN